MEQGHRAPRGSKLLAMQKMKDYSLSIFSCLQHTWGSNWSGCEIQTGSPSSRAEPEGEAVLSAAANH